MRKSSKIAGITLWASIFLIHAQAWGVIGGQLASPTSAGEIVYSIDSRLQSESIVCTATAVSSTQLLTAAHCFRHWIKNNCVGAKPVKNSCSTSFFLNGQEHTTQSVVIHPQFSVKDSTSKEYLNESNFDIAIVTLDQTHFQKYLKTAKVGEKQRKSLFFYGYGMSEIKKIELDNQEHFLEDKRGTLKKLKVKTASPMGGLLRLPSSTLEINPKTKKYALARKQDGQILRSDSGGPLISEGKIFAIARNYHLSNPIKEASQDFNLADNNDELTISSTFTDLRNPALYKFIKKHLKQ